MNDKSKIRLFLEEIHESLKHNKDGHVATYIPELGNVNPELFGISACFKDGTIIEVGDSAVDFCLQSTSKIFNYCMVREKLGRDFVHSHVGYEPSGRSFNEFVLNDQGLPHNPLINAGAIMTTSLINPTEEPSDRYNSILENYNDIAGHIGKITYDNSVFLSEKQNPDRNIALAYFMREKKAFAGKNNISRNKLTEHLDLYFQCCSISINCKIGAVMCGTLANGGICPVTNKKLFHKETIKDCLSLMLFCGMYDFCGQFGFEVGLPAKSGVSGCIMLVIPNVMGVCIWSPRLDKNHNSVRGIEVCRQISSKYGYHIFDKIEVNKNINCNLPESVLIQQLISAASDGNIQTIQELESTIDLGKAIMIKELLFIWQQWKDR